MITKRCHWCEGDELYENYHDKEWGIPVFDDKILFEFLVLETFQSGLSWITILRKRENFRFAFDDFDPKKIAQYADKQIVELLQNKKIIRNKAKIVATINNAKAFLKIQEREGRFAKYIWRFVDGKPIQNNFKTAKEIPVTNDLAQKIAKDLKQNGFKFIGPIVIFSHMEATGMMNNHVTSCFRHKEVKNIKIKTPF